MNNIKNFTVRDIAQTSVSRIWITFDADPEDYEAIDIKVDRPDNIAKYIKEEILNHEVFLMKALDDVLILSLYDLTLRD